MPASVRNFVLRTARVAPEEADFRPALPPRSLPGVNGAHMGKMSYGEQLKHPNWQRKRLEVLDSAKWACVACGDGESTLHVHHKRYVKGRMAWEYEAHELQALCEECHSGLHEHRELLDRLLMLGEGDVYTIAIGLLAGYLDCDLKIDDDALRSEAKAVGGPYFREGQMAEMLGRCSWVRAGRGIASALCPDTDACWPLNPAERSALEFLLSQPEPAWDM